MRDKHTLNLFWKFVIALVSIVAVFGGINLYLINYALYETFEQELTRHGTSTARSISERCIDPIVYEDLAALNRVVTDQKSIDSTIAYIFITDSQNKVLAHTFNSFVPFQLLRANPLAPDQSISIVKIKKNEHPASVIRDIAVPILDGSIGVVRIGFWENSFLENSRQTSRLFVLMVIIFLIIGILGVFFFSYIITAPINKINQAASRIELGTLKPEAEDLSGHIMDMKIIKWKNIFHFKDEIDDLMVSFNEMILRLKKAYSDLQKTQNSLFQSEKMASLGTLSAGLAHEINNPIAGMKNCLRRLKESPEKMKQNILYLEMMEQAVNKIETVVGGLLNFSRKPDIQFKKINLNDLIENVIVLIGYRLEKTRIGIHKNFGASDNMITASPNHLEQVFLNLLLNSIDAIEEHYQEDSNFYGEIHISITREAKHYKIVVSDNGGGVSESDRQEIFDPFYTKKKLHQGTGLGLAVCFGIVEQHGGEISAENNSIGGLDIIFTLHIEQ